MGKRPSAASRSRLTGIVANRRRLAIVAGAMLGFVASMPVVLAYSTGVFVSAFEQAYGWSRADTALCWSLYMLALFLGSTPAGRLADSLGAGRVATASMAVFGVSLILLPVVVHDLLSLWIAYALVSIAGLGTSPVVILKPVVAAFTARRGLAVAIAVCGAGGGAILVPVVATALIDVGSWRLAYAGFGAVALLVAPVLWLTQRVVPATPVTGRDGPVCQQEPGVSLAEASRLPRFWVLSAIALLTAAGVAGILVHLVPLLGDFGKSPREAAELAALLGVASIAGRIGGGLLLDHISGPVVGVVLIGCCAIGLLLLAVLGAKGAVPGVLLIGCALGSELDLFAYFISRYFGLRAHSAIFGWNYSLMALAGMCSPYLLGVLYDWNGDYEFGLQLLSGIAAAGALLCLALGPYRYGRSPDDR
ncbi:MAG: MFS transporter [Gammaproteobacteria bacterium]|nr:MAG: MFS transporter [Gammaproteobacteria bacterium]